MNIIEIQDSLKDLPDSALMREMQMPSGSAPQFLVLSELKRRKRMRDEFQRQQNMDMPTVAEEVVTAAGMPQEGIMGAARAMTPNTNVAQNTGMDMAASVPATRAPQMMADGGIMKLAPGGSVGRPVEPFPANSPNPRDRSNWMAMYKDTHNLDGSPKSLSPDVAQSEGIAALSADAEDYMAPGIRMTTQDKLSAALGDVDRRVPRSLSMLSSPEDQDVVRGPEVEAAMETQNVLEEMMKANQGIARDETPTGQLDVDALGNVLGFNPEDPTVGGEAMRLAEASMTDAPLDIRRSNLDAQMGTQRIGIGTDPSIRDTLPEVVREDDLRFSRGTASADAVKDALTDYRRTTDEKGYPFDSTLRSADRLLDGELPYIKAPSLDTDVVDPSIGTRPRTAADFAGVDIGADANTVAEMNKILDLAGIGPATSSDVDMIDLMGQAADERGGYEAFAELEAGGEPKTVTRRTGRKDSSSDGSFSLSDFLPDIGFRNAITDLYKEDATVTPNEASVVDTAATEDLITEESKVESDDKKAPTIRPKLRPADLLTPTDPSGPSGPSGLSGADLSIASLLEARKKEAEADKWMALAYAGMELMKPTATIGEGLGKAGQAGLGYLTKSKKGLQDFETDMLKLQTQRDIANIRAAASGKSSSSASLTTNRVILKELLATVDNELARIDLTGRGKIPPEKLDDYNRLIEERQNIIEEMRKLTTLGSSGSSGNSGLSGTFDVPSKPQG